MVDVQGDNEVVMFVALQRGLNVCSFTKGVEGCLDIDCVL